MRYLLIFGLLLISCGSDSFEDIPNDEITKTDVESINEVLNDFRKVQIQVEDEARSVSFGGPTSILENCDVAVVPYKDLTPPYQDTETYDIKGANCNLQYIRSSIKKMTGDISSGSSFESNTQSFKSKSNLKRITTFTSFSEDEKDYFKGDVLANGYSLSSVINHIKFGLVTIRAKSLIKNNSGFFEFLLKSDDFTILGEVIYRPNQITYIINKNTVSADKFCSYFKRVCDEKEPAKKVGS